MNVALGPGHGIDMRLKNKCSMPVRAEPNNRAGVLPFAQQPGRKCWILDLPFNCQWIFDLTGLTGIPTVSFDSGGARPVI